MRALSLWLLNTDRHRVSTTSLGSLLQCLTTLIAQKCFPVPSLTLLWQPSATPIGARSRAWHLSAPPPHKAAESSKVIFAPPPAWTAQVSSAFSHRTHLPTLLSVLVPPLEAFKDSNTLFILWRPELHMMFKVRLYHHWIEWDNHLFWPAVRSVFDAPQNVVCLLAANHAAGSFWAAVTCTPNSLSAELLSTTLVPSMPVSDIAPSWGFLLAYSPGFSSCIYPGRLQLVTASF